MEQCIFKQQLEDKDGFQIYFYAYPETNGLEMTFDDSVDDIKELYRQINDGLLVYFVASVEAYKHGTKLGTDYLGGCLYKSFDDFINEKDGYITDMINEAVKEAKNTIKKLLEG